MKDEISFEIDKELIRRCMEYLKYAAKLFKNPKRIYEKPTYEELRQIESSLYHIRKAVDFLGKALNVKETKYGRVGINTWKAVLSEYKENDTSPSFENSIGDLFQKELKCVKKSIKQSNNKIYG